jgi:hypothetical protein
MDALTPAGRLFGPLWTMNTVLTPAGLPAYRLRPSCRSALNHLKVPGIVFTLPLNVPDPCPMDTSGLHCSYASSSSLAAESGSLSLRTGSSSPVAPHPASRRRSYGWLRAGERLPGTDFHRSSRCPSQAHIGSSCVWTAKSLQPPRAVLPLLSPLYRPPAARHRPQRFPLTTYPLARSACPLAPSSQLLASVPRTRHQPSALPAYLLPLKLITPPVMPFPLALVEPH